jgi:hypothetical protein
MYYLIDCKNGRKKPTIIRVSKDLDELKNTAIEMKAYNKNKKYQIYDKDNNLIFTAE